MAGKKNTVTQVYELAKPIADELGLYLWDVRFEKEGSSWYLRIYIDSDDGITFEDCEALSRPMSKLLDEKDFIEQAYYLEVGSPGLMRELRRPDHFEVCIGDEVLVKLIRPRDGQREFIGVLKSYDHGDFVIENETGDLAFNTADCSFVKLNDDVEF
jgi:ribosome maturation factor RimP